MNISQHIYPNTSNTLLQIQFMKCLLSSIYFTKSYKNVAFSINLWEYGEQCIDENIWLFLGFVPSPFFIVISRSTTFGVREETKVQPSLRFDHHH